MLYIPKIKHTFHEWTKEEHFSLVTENETKLAIVFKGVLLEFYRNFKKVEFISELHEVEQYYINELLSYAKNNSKNEEVNSIVF